jgi:hypothetical protein
MADKDVFVVPAGENWGVRRPNKNKLSKKFDTKNEAIEYGKELAKKDKSELTILKKDGKIQNKNSYGNDPYPPKDKKY